MKLEEFEKRLQGGAGDPWRELLFLAEELIKLKKQLQKIEKRLKIHDD